MTKYNNFRVTEDYGR